MSFTKLRYHLVFATKNRRRCLKDGVREFAWLKLCEFAEDIGGYVIAVGGIEDHVHMLAGLPPTAAISSFVQQVKRRATTAIRREYPLRLKGFKWQKGYGGFTVSAHDIDGLVRYIDNQEEHHRLGTLREDVEAFMEHMEG